MKILGIETSCDDTCVAIYDSKNDLLICNYKYNQHSLHMRYKGIVPELAACQHLSIIDKIINIILSQSNLSIYSINAISYTAGPGMVSSLFIGAAVAVSLAFILNIPIIKVHHMEAHLLSPFIEKSLNIPRMNFLGLLISGGHTQLIQAKNLGNYKILGTTLDDSIGDVLDKIANLLNLDYPGGSKISVFSKKGNIGKFHFPRPMMHNSSFNFSFSGLKTCVSKFIKKYNNNLQSLCDIAKEFENAIFDSVILKCIKAIKYTGYKKIVVSGGVSANIFFREKMILIMNKYNCKVFFPEIKYCTDNAAMIAYMGYLRFKNNKQYNIIVKPKWSLEQLQEF
ncbi:tRNA (adenosine(37)-N6)-threonylcarbamoyltransferase complex transferase subunit TsaD [Buchnera aphidicola (Mollitrichosiphum nigrofasciatum)]|uniref:tRNA (adenosine(37)-N6)-threonylcarbamoyltransferase complex transferase subunit TsaD n=1 Tax=Buchnera aphidicola TaxID=9 RepID=UPI0031B7FE47